MKSLPAWGLLGTISVFSGCAHAPRGTGAAGGSIGDYSGRDEAPTSIQEILDTGHEAVAAGSDAARNASAVGAVEPMVVNGIRLQNARFDYPVVINTRVLFWVDYFTGRGREHFAKYLSRSDYFIPYIRPILRQHGLPEDLVYLAMIESGFNNHARSHAKAVGPWQFISATGKRYGLQVNWWIDERRDTRKSTVAAVEYLKDLYNMFQSWELAAAAYNAGEAKIARAVQRYGTRDFWALIRHRFLRPETRDYVPKIMAAAIIEKNRTLFGFDPPGKGLPEPDDSEPDSPATGNLAEVSETTADDEEIAESDTPESVGDILQANSAAPQTPAGIASGESQDPQSPSPQAKPVSPPHVDRKGELSGEEIAEFEIRGPADLMMVARAANLTYPEVKALNPELLRWCTPPAAAYYRLKLPASAKDRFLETYNHSAYPRRVEFLTYRARGGDTLGRIARHFGIRVDPIVEMNRISPRSILRKGASVLLPMPNDRSRSLASLDLRDPPSKKRVRRAGARRSKGKSYKVSYKKRESARGAVKRSSVVDLNDG